MKKSSVVVALLILTQSIALAGSQQQKSGTPKILPLDGVPNVVMKNRTNSEYMHDRVILKLMPRIGSMLSKSAFGIQSIDRVLSRLSVVSIIRKFPTVSPATNAREVDLSLFYVVRYSSPHDPFTLAEDLSKLPEVQFAEPWFIYSLASGQFSPNDPLFNQQWGLQKINAAAAWDVTQGDSSIVIAIVDSGVEWAHPDLIGNIWTNPGESGADALGRDKRSNGTDDDGNGFVDDWHGWDLVGSDFRNPQADNNPAPTGANNTHGTHVAGIAAASTNNGLGVASIGFRCKLLPVKTTADLDTRGSGGTAYILAGYDGIVYAAQMGAKIINCSWGGAGGSQLEQDVVTFATQRGSLIVAAAGNNGSDTFFSPAGYRNVLGVAATDRNDQRAFFSNYGEIVDVSAPGVDILSTLYQSTYVSFGWSGTSMASPFAAGLAALVRTRFPSLTPLQVGEQVRVTSDNIDAGNPSYANKLGFGRINALRALTVTDLPSVRLQSFSVMDAPGGNGNGFAQPAETLSIRCTFRNYLARTSPDARVEILSSSSYISVMNGAFPVPDLGTLDSISNLSTPFRVYVQPFVPQSYTATLQLRFTDGSFTDVQSISFLVNPTFQTHNINDIQLTLTNNGALGFFDYPDNALGVGFIFNGANHLFEGGLIIGTSSTKLASVVRDSLGGQDADFFSNDFYTLATPGRLSQQDGFTSFTDTRAPFANQFGVKVNMHSYAYSDPLDSRYVILRYDIRNTGTTTLSNLYTGIFLDWDLGDYNKNVSNFDPTRSLGYCYDASNSRREYVGIRALDSAASYRTLLNTVGIQLGRSAKWSWISGGISDVQGGPYDIHHVISSGPFTIAPGDSQTIGFALVAGDSSLADIQQNADAAKAKWQLLRRSNFLPVSVNDRINMIPRVFALSQNYPNPFNPRTTFEVRVANHEMVSLKVFDLLGREMATLLNERQAPGVYKMVWDASLFPSGAYFARMKAGSFVETRKLVLMK
ncbi:MAG TPA: hypothetical protein DCP63_11965 [Bacteroidetes bacterium]|nr:hypothetical protein [Bacteroidota bacterium]